MRVDVRVVGMESDGVALVSPTHPDFDALARPRVGRMAELALRLKPYVVIVSNQATRVVAAFAVVWRVYQRRGLSTTSRNQFKYPEAVCGDALDGRRNGFLPPGRLRVVGNGCEVEGAGEHGETPDTWLDQFVKSKDAELAQATGVEIELDAVIFDDGSLLGQDESQLGEHFTIYVHAKQECYRAILDALDAGTSVDDAFRAMSAPFTGQPSIKEDLPTMYQREATADASVARRRIGDAHFAEWIRQHVRLTPFALARR